MTIYVSIISELSVLFSRFDHFTPSDPSLYIYIFLIVIDQALLKKIKILGRKV